MKTKTDTKSKILIVSAAILCCAISAFSQNQIIPSMQDFQGTWIGNNIDGRVVSVTLTSDWKSTFTVSGVPLISSNPVIAYRLPQYLSASPITSPEITIKFYTQGAIDGVRIAANNNASATLSDNSVSVNTIEQIYTGLAMISFNSSGQLEMALYMDAQNFTTVPPALDVDASNKLYCTLTKQ